MVFFYNVSVADDPDGSASFATHLLDPETIASEKVMTHQLAILNTAFYLVEQFDAGGSAAQSVLPPAIALVLRSLTKSLIRLALYFLRDTPRGFLPPARLAEVGPSCSRTVSALKVFGRLSHSFWKLASLDMPGYFRSSLSVRLYHSFALAARKYFEVERTKFPI